MHDVLLPSSRLGRLAGAYRYPDQAALVARIPLIGRRVPARSYWRRRPVVPAELARESLKSAPIVGRLMPASVATPRPGPRLGATAAALRSGARDLIDRMPAAAGGLWAKRPRAHGPHGAEHEHVVPGRRQVIHLPVRTVATRIEPQRASRSAGALKLAAGAAAFAGAGALLMYYLDPVAGRRRRALVRDRAAHVKNVFTRSLPRRIEQRGRFMAGVARGIRHDAAGIIVHDGQHAAIEDDETLVARVRSEVLRRRGIKAGEIHLDAYEGCVTLRGQLQHMDDIRRLIEDTRHVDGVRQVRSYLHLPGTLAPNKAEVYEREHVPAHLAR